MGVLGYVWDGLKEVALSEYHQAKEANKKTDDYGKFVGIMEKATERNESCKPDEFSRGCGNKATLPQYYQDGMTTHGVGGYEIHGTPGTAPLRIYTVKGSDGQTINVQAFDGSKTVKYTVVHKDGKSDVETLDADEATKRIQREAGYPDPNNRL